MSPLVVDGVAHVSLPELEVGDVVRLVGDEPNTVLEVCVFGSGRAYLLVQVSAFADPIKVWLRRHSLIQLLSEPRKPSAPATTPDVVNE